MVVEVPALPTIYLIGCSSTFETLFWGRGDFFNVERVISARVLPLLRRINTRQLKTFHI